MSDRTQSESANLAAEEEATAVAWTCLDCGHKNELRESCQKCGRDRSGDYFKAATKSGTLNRQSLGIALAISLLGAPALTYLFVSSYWNILPPGAGLEILVFISTPFCAALVMILVAVVMIYAARREAKRPFLYGAITAVVAYIVLWIAGYIFVATNQAR